MDLDHAWGKLMQQDCRFLLGMAANAIFGYVEIEPTHWISSWLNKWDMDAKAKA